jgi:hypothetical protein
LISKNTCGWAAFGATENSAPRGIGWAAIGGAKDTLHTPGNPGVLVDWWSNVELKKIQMTCIWFSEFQQARFRKGWLFKINL